MSTRIHVNGKVIAITGGNQGLGIGITQCCLESGAKVVYSLDISAPGNEHADLSAKYPGQMEYVQCDVTNADSVDEAVEEIVRRSGRLDGMIGNAGVTDHRPILEFTKKDFDRIFQIDVYGVFNAARSAAKQFIKQGGGGSIVFTASMAGYRPNKAGVSTVYTSAKAAVIAMARSLAVEWSEKYGIRVNTVSPGLVKTALTAKIVLRPNWDQEMTTHMGMKRLGEVQEIGTAYVYLLSDAASFTTGTDVPVYGAAGVW